MAGVTGTVELLVNLEAAGGNSAQFIDAINKAGVDLGDTTDLGVTGNAIIAAVNIVENTLSPAANVAGVMLNVTVISEKLRNNEEMKLSDCINLAGNVLGLLGSIYPPFKVAGVVLNVAGIALGLNPELDPGYSPFSEKDNEIDSGVSDGFSLAQKVQQRKDPLTIDLDGDGLETVGANEIGSVLFDHDGDGLKTRSGWVKPDDGLLVLDRNGNGTIDTGAELFGDSTVKSNGQKAVDGFDALADLDSNRDGKLNAADARFAELRVWRDLNSDGISTTNELLTLQAAGIAEFNVAKKENSQTLSNGNQIADTGSYLRTNGELALIGEVGHMADVDLAEDTFHREFTTTIPLDEDVKDLPAMKGSGKVRDLLEAASQSDSLKALLQQYVAIDDREGQIALIDQMPASVQPSRSKPSITANTV